LFWYSENVAGGWSSGLFNSFSRSWGLRASSIFEYGGIRVQQRGDLEGAKDLTARADAIRADMVRLAR
jgi:hypothetical protein